MSKIWMIGASLMAFSVAGALAEAETKQEAAPLAPAKQELKALKPKSELKELSLEGVIHKIETKRKNGTVSTALKLVTDDGAVVMLPNDKPGKNDPAGGLESSVGLRVKIVGMGYESEKNGKKRCGLKTIKSVQKVEVPALPASAPTN